MNYLSWTFGKNMSPKENVDLIPKTLQFNGDNLQSFIARIWLICVSASV